jgi:hypothetical protein
VRAPPRIRALSAGTLLVVAFLAAGCGGGGGGSSSSQPSGEAAKPATQIVEDAMKAARAASSVHMAGQVAESGKQIGVDLSFVRGKGTTGTFTLRGTPVQLVLVGKQAYLRAGPAFWRQFKGGTRAAQLLAGRWLKFAADNGQLGSLAAVANDKTLFDQLASEHGKLENQGATTYKSQSVVAIHDTGKPGSTLYVAASGTPYPVALVKTKGRTGGTITFDKWNEPVKLTAPKGALDLSQLGSG